MKFDLFHSIGRIDSLRPAPRDADVFRAFFEQTRLADSLEFSTIWVAESHFSSEVQKHHKEPVIPHYQGEVGLNCDSAQLAHEVFGQTQRIGFGTAIFNIVGGNGGPIAAADRMRSLAFLNLLKPVPRRLHIGIAAGRFPYINRPFGIVPRSEQEAVLWPQYGRLIFLEALEIFLRLSRGDVLSSRDVTRLRITRALFKDDSAWNSACVKVGVQPSAEGFAYVPRWDFEPLKLVPEMTADDVDRSMNFVLGSADDLARETAMRFADCDIFNLSFTAPDQLNKIHETMFARYSQAGRRWHRSRLPRTVLIFIDPDPRVAAERASACFDTYIEAMRGTAAVPSKDVLMARALIGDSAMIRDQLAPEDPHGFHPDDRLMLWFEFNQSDSASVMTQMRQFAEDVMPHFC